MDEEKLISIIVPVYNIEQYIEKCILSIINQTYNNLQIILVDDGSTDCSGQICDVYSHNLVTIIDYIFDFKKNTWYVALKSEACGLTVSAVFRIFAQK